MDRIERWKLAEEMNQIVLLIAGYDPAEFERDRPHDWAEEVRQDISPYLNALKNAARNERLEFRAVEYENGYNNEIDWESSTINIASLCDAGTRIAQRALGALLGSAAATLIAARPVRWGSVAQTGPLGQAR